MASVIRGSDGFDTATLGLTAGSLTTNGYAYLPNGLIMQWLSFDTLATGNATYNFPISFPTACLTVVQGNKGDLQASFYGISSFTTTDVTINTSSTTQDGYILAIGY